MERELHEPVVVPVSTLRLIPRKGGEAGMYCEGSKPQRSILDCVSRGTSEQASETAETAKPEEEVLTVENSSDLAALLAITDYCIEPAAVFAAQHQGKTIAFD